MQNEKHFCALCNNVATQKCSACQAAYYCCQEHQKSHWKTHSKNCRAYKLVENSKLGKHYVATRNIKRGETVIYDKAPLITVPNHFAVVVKADGSYSINLDIVPVCLSCYVKLTADNAKPCDKCGWPLCHKCTKHGNECEFTKKHARLKVNICKGQYGQPHPAYEIIGVIRSLALRENDPKSYRKLMNHEDLPTHARLLDSSFVKAARFTKTFFKIDDVQEAEILKIMRIMMINADTVVPKRGPITVPAPTAEVYDISSYTEHNCRANCSRSLTEEWGTIVWAAVPISKGDHITVCYMNSLLGTQRRRFDLAINKFFDCDCERCKDPTEFGTMFDAIKCRRENCDGCMLPPTFLITEGSYPDYVCSKCSATTPYQSDQFCEASIYIDWTRMNKFNISECENFIAKWKNFLHENHFYIVDVEIALARNIGSRADIIERSDKSLTDLVKLCKKLTTLVETLAPAETRIRGVLLYIHFLVNRILMKRIEPAERDKHFHFILENARLTDEIYFLLRREPTSFSLENSIARIVLDVINKVSAALPITNLEQQFSACAL